MAQAALFQQEEGPLCDPVHSSEPGPGHDDGVRSAGARLPSPQPQKQNHLREQRRGR